MTPVCLKTLFYTAPSVQCLSAHALDVSLPKSSHQKVLPVTHRASLQENGHQEGVVTPH